MPTEIHAYNALVNSAAALGAKRPVWTGNEAVAQSWIDRAERLLKVAKNGLDTSAAIKECNAYCGLKTSNEGNTKMTTERSQHIKVISKLLTITQQVYSDEAIPERFAAAYNAGFSAMQKVAAGKTGKSVSEKRLSEIREWMCEASKDCNALFDAIMSTDPRELD